VTFPPDLAQVVDQLAVAKKKLVHMEEAVAKLQAAELLVNQLRARLVTMLGQHGFTEEAVDLLLAAR
jgi:hypothetical protein